MQVFLCVEILMFVKMYTECIEKNVYRMEIKTVKKERKNMI